MRIHRSLLAGTGLAALLSTTAVAGPRAGDRYVAYTGRATARHSQAFLYGEKHLLVERAGKTAERVVLLHVPRRHAVCTENSVVCGGVRT